MKALILILTGMFLSSCIKEESTTTTGFLLNSTSHNIELRAFRNGINTTSTTVSVPPHSEIKIGERYEHGLVALGQGFSSEKLDGDSIHVIFDGVYQTTHYLNNPASTAVNHYLYQQPRNVYWINKYEGVVTSQKKHLKAIKYTYTFIEQDYVDAQ
ncbi:MAG TPA: hypothetical protein VMY77_18605 [Chitinophagaceae bacterium]|nr:hypothetical protein [Chitinophagaceae bacterium]